MAGIEYSGFEYSKLDLFQGASMVLTPVTGTAIDVVDRIIFIVVSDRADDRDKLIIL